MTYQEKKIRDLVEMATDALNLVAVLIPVGEITYRRRSTNELVEAVVFRNFIDGLTGWVICQRTEAAGWRFYVPAALAVPVGSFGLDEDLEFVKSVIDSDPWA